MTKFSTNNQKLLHLSKIIVMHRAYLLSIISGLLFALAWPTYGFPILLFFAFVPLLLIEDQFSFIDEIKNKASKIFFLSFISFYIWNLITYFWLSKAHPENPTNAELGQAWFAFGFASVVNTLLMSLVFLYFHKIKKRHGNLYGYLFFVVGWIGLERLHLNWDFAWPWLNLGNGFASYHKWIQWYEFTGSFGGTFWILTGNILLFFCINYFLNHDRKKGIKYLGIFLIYILVPIIISLAIYQNYEEKGDEISVGLIQPNLDSYKEKYSKSSDEIVADLISIMEDENLKNVNILVTPETSIPGRGSLNVDELKSDYNVNQILNFLQERPNTILLVGASTTKYYRQSKTPNDTSIPIGDDLWANPSNSVIQISNDSSVFPIYNKSKLVVGVELFPYAKILKPLLGDAMLNFGGGIYSLTGQSKPKVFLNDKNKAKIAPLICYESIFGGYTSKFVNDGANLISISTNDSWWGNTQGHKQLLAYAKLRAIENRRAIVRAANSGISAFINQRGDVVKQLDYETKGSLRGVVKLNNKKTYYSKYNDLIVRIALIILSVLLGVDISLFLKKLFKL